METRVNIGLSDENREKIAEGLAEVLADSYMLYVRTHNYHWNVKGQLFHPLHEQFEEQYLDLADAVDGIAERIRALGHRAPGSFKEFKELSSLEEDSGETEALEMVRLLVVGNEKVIQSAREVIQTSEDAGDVATADLLTARLEVHSKTAWMLRSHLE